MNSTVFKFIDRGKQDAIVLVPGWATDHRIFDSLELPFNYLMPVSLSPHTFEKALVAALEDNKLDKISLFGWSMGGFLAYEFALRHIDFVDELILVSIRKRYPPENIKEIEESLKTRKKGFLHWFFDECFCHKEQEPGSRKDLFKGYCREMELDYLLRTLDYLAKVELEPELLQQIQKVTIIHGENDRIAPLNEAIAIKNSVTNARFILIKEAGHIPFLEVDFGRYIG